MRLFDRVVNLRVGDTEINGLDISFEIEKDETPAPNPCHIEIYNLCQDNRAVLSKYEQVPVMLKAGYKNHDGIIFQGDLIRCQHLKEGPNWKTVLASGDGVMAIQTKRTDKTYAKGTPLKTVIEDLSKQVGLPKASAIGHLTELDQTLARSFVVSGNPMAEVTRILSNKNIQASIQNQSLQVRRKGQAIQKEAVILSATSGLIESPEIGTKGDLTVRSLLMPELLPGRQVKIESAMFNGFAVIKTIRFMGSNFGTQWEAEMVCKASE